MARRYSASAITPDQEPGADVVTFAHSASEVLVGVER
jgi:hypothetical protein